MLSLPHYRPQGPRLHIILLEIAAFTIGLSAIALSQQPVAIGLVGIMLITLHTLLIYRMGKIAGRLTTADSTDFLRGFKQGLVGRPD